MTTEVKTALALKEWAAVIEAMLQGRQSITLRKGGIREKAFLVEGRSFYLLPTFEHQAPELVKPAFRDTLDAVPAHRDEGGLIVRARATLEAMWEIDDAERLDALAPWQMFTEDYTRSRFDWRPKKPLTVLLLRAHRLEAPWATGLPAGAGGCRSWLELDATAAPVDAGPVLDDARFVNLTERLQSILGPAREESGAR